MMNGDENQTISDEQSVVSSVNPTWPHSRNSSNFQARAISVKSSTSVTSQMSSFYSMQANDSKKNLFKRIVSCRYGPRFEYLLNLFENTVNIKESIQASFLNDTMYCHLIRLANSIINRRTGVESTRTFQKNWTIKNKYSPGCRSI